MKDCKTVAGKILRLPHHCIILQKASIKTIHNFPLSGNFLHPFHPDIQFCLQRFQTASALGVEFHCHLTGKLRALTGLCHVPDHMAGPAAVRHERDHRFSRKILSLQKSKNRRSYRVPPGGSFNRDHVIIRHIYTERLNRRTVPSISFRFPLLYPGLGRERSIRLFL